MTRKIWGHDSSTILLCVDSYTNGVLQGEYFNHLQEAVKFDSLSQFLIMVEEMLADSQAPQAYTTTRSFLPKSRLGGSPTVLQHRQGEKATFEVKILFRQHSSWQGVIVWLEKQTEQSFRSVLELVHLLDSALKDSEEDESQN